MDTEVTDWHYDSFRDEYVCIYLLALILMGAICAVAYIVSTDVHLDISIYFRFHPG